MDDKWEKTRLTLGIVSLSEQQARLLRVRDGPIRRRDIRDAMPQKALELMHIVCALAPTSCMLTVYGIYSQTSGPNTQDKRVLHHIVGIAYN